MEIYQELRDGIYELQQGLWSCEWPNGVKHLWYKWVYKKKRGIGGKFGTFKARLVTKNFSQREGIDYEETFSPVVMLISIRIILSIVPHYDHEVWQMDIKTTFLNKHIDQTIYLM